MSEFKKAVLNVVEKIPPGSVASYGQIALLAGVPRAARQVGNILCEHGETVPWWRVINNSGRISIKCLDHTANTQREKLQKGGVKVNNNLKIEINKYRWYPSPKNIEILELTEENVTLLMEKFF